MLEESRKFRRAVDIANFLTRMESFVLENGHKEVRPVLKKFTRARTNKEKFHYYRKIEKLLKTKDI